MEKEQDYQSIQNVPKPMVLIKGKPLIIYIMKHYAKYGYKDFIIATGYKHNYIKIL